MTVLTLLQQFSQNASDAKRCLTFSRSVSASDWLAFVSHTPLLRLIGGGSVEI